MKKYPIQDKKKSSDLKNEILDLNARRLAAINTGSNSSENLDFCNPENLDANFISNNTNNDKSKSVKENLHAEKLNKSRKDIYESSNVKSVISSRLERLIPDFIHEVSSPINVLDHALSNLSSDFDKLLSQIRFTYENNSNEDFCLTYFTSIRVNTDGSNFSLNARDRRKSIASWLKGFGFKRFQQGADIILATDLKTDDEFLNSIFSNDKGERYFELLLSILYIRQSLIVLDSAKNRSVSLVKSLKNYKDISPDEEPLSFLLNDTISEAITILGHRLRARKFSLKVEENFQLVGIPQYLTHVWINLLANAIEATDEKGNIELNVFKKENKLFVTVEDNGQGIASHNLERIFDPYYTTKGEKGGTGIGLSLCRKYLESMDADLSVVSEKGSTVFTACFNFKIK